MRSDSPGLVRDWDGWVASGCLEVSTIAEDRSSPFDCSEWVGVRFLEASGRLGLGVPGGTSSDSPGPLRVGNGHLGFGVLVATSLHAPRLVRVRYLEGWVDCWTLTTWAGLVLIDLLRRLL
jgi:hypothetical protein